MTLRVDLLCAGCYAGILLFIFRRVRITKSRTGTGMLRMPYLASLPSTCECCALVKKEGSSGLSVGKKEAFI